MKTSKPVKQSTRLLDVTQQGALQLRLTENSQTSLNLVMLIPYHILD